MNPPARNWVANRDPAERGNQAGGAVGQRLAFFAFPFLLATAFFTADLSA